MRAHLIIVLATGLVASCSPAKSAREEVERQMQFVFTHFKGERVKLSINGKVAFDQAISVAPENQRNGIASVAQINLPGCADLVVQAGTQRLAQQLCINATTKSIAVDGGPPLSIAQLDRFQGED